MFEEAAKSVKDNAVDFGAQIWHGAVEKPLMGPAQLVTGKQYEAPESSKSIGGVLGQAVGTGIDLALMSKLPIGKAGGAVRLGTTGALYGGVFTPTESGTLTERGRAALTMGGSMFTLGGVTSAMVSRGVFAKETLRDRVLLNGAAGVPVGFVDTALHATLDGKPQDILSGKLALNVAGSVFLGGAFGAAGHGLDVAMRRPLAAPAVKSGVEPVSPYAVAESPAVVLDKTIHVDNVVVGGGIAGATSAYGMIKAGPGRTALVTDGRVASPYHGETGSGNNMGMITTASDTYPQELAATLGPEKYQLFIKALREGQAGLASLARSTGIDVYRHSSYWVSYPWGQGIPTEMRQAYMAADPLVRYHSGRQAQDLFKPINEKLAGHVNQALEIRNEFSVDNPVQLTRAIIDAARRQAGPGNMDVFENSKVLRFSYGPDGKVHLETTGGKIIADRAIFATGNGELLGGRVQASEPTRVYAMTAELTAAPPKVRHNIYDTEEPLNAFKINPQGRLFFSNSDQAATEAVRLPDEVYGAARALLGEFKNATAWSGLIHVADRPTIGLLDKRVGFIGNMAGVGLAPSGLALSEWRYLFNGQPSRWGTLFAPAKDHVAGT